jgi:transcriptional regulator with XRE-family HTH domain
MSKTRDKPITNVVDLIRDIADADFVEELEEHLRQGAILRSLMAKRIAKGVSQGDIAERLGCSQSRVSKLERGTDGDLKLEELAAYGEATGHEFEIIGHRLGSRPVDRVKAYVLCIHRELQSLTSMATDDDRIADGFTEFFGETFFNLVNLLNDAAKTLPDRPLISIQLDADVENEPAADPAQPARQRARRKRPGERAAT